MSTPAAPPPDDALKRALMRLAAGGSLDEATAAAAFERIMAGEGTPAVVGALLLAMRTRGETAEELAGAVRALRGAMRRVAVDDPGALVDTCGTGGGSVGTLNVSTAAAFVAAGAGIPIAKHGNRSFTSRSGSADVLEALGLPIDLAPERAAAVLRQAGIVFLYAPSYHPAMRHVQPVRRELAVPTLMNLVGPLANPAGALRQVVGVSDPTRAPRIAEALLRLGSRHALVVHGEIGMDEIAPIGMTRVWEVRDGRIAEWSLDPTHYGVRPSSLDGLEGGTPEENAARLTALLERPTEAPAVVRGIVLLNAAAAIHVGGTEATLATAFAAAERALLDGAAAGRLTALRAALSTSG